MASLSLKNVTKVYKGNVKAVDNFTMDIEDGEFIVFVGPSGCGKSTTLRMIAGLEDITSGELYINGEYMNDVEPKDRNLAMVFQDYALYPYLTVFDNIAFGLKLRHVPKEEIKTKVHEVAKVLGIEEYLDRKPKALSGGQRQRVALGRAIVRDAKVYLFDEPLSNLDAKLRGAMRVEIIRLYEKLKTTFIYVTHDQVEAMTMGTRIVVMKDGIIQQIDTPTNLYDHPINKFVAGFIGTPPMNFFKVNYNKGNIVLENGVSIKCPKDLVTAHNKFYKSKVEAFSNINNEIDVSDFKGNEQAKQKFIAQKEIELAELQKKADYFKNNLKNEHQMILGIRSENIHVAQKDDELSFLARVGVVETLGSECLVYLKLDVNDQELNLRGHNNEFVMKLQGKSPFHFGDVIKVAFDQKSMHLFDELTEENIL